jgi:hypothetical protein
MTISMKRAAFLLSGTIAAGMFGGVAMAADVETPTALPAVSDINGKVVLGGGWADIDSLGDDSVFRGGAALSFPVGDMFGIQADVSALDSFGDTAAGGALHAFTRDPTYCLAPGANKHRSPMSGMSAEVTLSDNISTKPSPAMDVSTTGSEYYAVGDVGAMPPTARLSVGASTLYFSSAHAGLDGSGRCGVISLTSIAASARIFSSIMAGVSLAGGETEPDPFTARMTHASLLRHLQCGIGRQALPLKGMGKDQFIAILMMHYITDQYGSEINAADTNNNLL